MCLPQSLLWLDFTTGAGATCAGLLYPCGLLTGLGDVCPLPGLGTGNLRFRLNTECWLSSNLSVIRAELLALL